MAPIAEYTEARPAGRGPKVSVIIPFAGDPRGKPRHVLSWTRRQTCPASDFEVIVACNGISPEWEREIASYLRPQDRLIPAQVENGFALYDIGAQAASGELLFITEDHCVAEPACLAEALRYFAAHDEQAASMCSGHINHTPLALMEQLAYERCLPLWLEPDHWDKLRIRSFVIRRSLYFAAGGLPGRYDHFAEALLSARLHAAGHKVGYIPVMGVRHVNTRTFFQLTRDIGSFVRGECLFRTEGDADFCERYFQMVPEWSERFFASRRQSLAAGWAVWRTLLSQFWRLRHIGGMLSLVRGGCAWLTLALGGARLRLLPPFLALVAARLRCAWWRWDEQRRLGAFVDCWQQLVRYMRVRHLVEHPGDDRTEDGLASCRYDMAEVSQRQLAGFHTRETWNGKTFRWSGPLALLRCRVPRGNHEVTIDTGSLRSSCCSFPFGLFWNGRMIPPKSIDIENGRIMFPVDLSMFVPGPEQRLTIVCAPMRRRRGAVEQRLLGLPVCSVEFRPTQEAELPQSRNAA